MMHRTRIWGAPVVAQELALALALTQYTWTSCTAWALPGGETLLLNDSTCAGGAQEYAVLRLLSGQWFQVESITFGWCTTNEAFEYLAQITAGQFDDERVDGPLSPRFHPASAVCPLCA